MKLKEKLIRALVDVGKKHRILVYPTLALIAVITAISNAIYWGRGNGKRFVASVTVIALLFTQSLFLTSSANTSEDTPGEGNVATDSDAEYYDSDEIMPVLDDELTPQGDAAAPAFSTLRVNVKLANSTEEAYYTVNLTDNGDGTYSIPGDAFDTAKVNQAMFGSAATDPNVTITGLFSDAACSTSVAGTDVSALTKNDADERYEAYALVTINKITVTYVASDDATITTTYDVDTTGTAREKYDAANNQIILTLDGADSNYGIRKGYNFTGVTKPDGAQVAKDPAAIPNTVNIPVTSKSTSITITTNWAPKDVTFTYDAILDSDPLKTVSVTEDVVNPQLTYEYSAAYADADPVAQSWATPNDGYVFKHWTYNGTPVTGISTVKDLLDTNASIDYTGTAIDGGTLVGVWEYKDYSLTGLDSDGAISGTYGDTLNFNVGVKYKSGAAVGDQFGMKISDATIASLASEYGIIVNPGTAFSGNAGYYENYTFEATGGVKKIATAVNIPVDICDMNKPTAGGANIMSTNIPLNIAKRVVTIKPDTVMDSTATTTAPRKIYDGNTDINVYQQAAVDNVAFSDVITATFDGLATLESKDAGTDKKDITLKNVSLVGTAKDNYTIVTEGATNNVTIADRGTVEQKAINVQIKVKDSDPATKSATVKYGQSNPEFELYINDSDLDNLTADDKSAYNSNKTSFFTNILGFTQFDYARNKYSAPDINAYSVTPKFSGEKNYIVNMTGLEGKITVTRDVAALNTNYQMSDKQTAQYYQDITISPIGGYDQIRICSNASDDVTTDAMLSGFKSELTYADLGDMTDATIYVQMRKSDTGAITTIATIANLSIDKNAPTLSSFSVNPYDKLNIFNFGSYYHPQVVEGSTVNVVTFTFVYEADNSKCDKLHYYFEDKNGNPTGNTVADRTFTEISPGKFEATVTMSVDEYGQLIVYATDVAGNPSAFSRINVSTWNDFASTATKPSDYYEWMVENTSTDADLVVTSDGAVATTQDVIYNHLDLSIDANDVVGNNAVSGVNKVVWTVTDSGNNVVYTNTATVPDTNKKYTSYTFTERFPIIGAEVLGDYKVSAKVYDNAGNVTDLGPKGAYRVDSILPTVTDNTAGVASGSFASGVSFKFNVAEGADESGIEKITLYKKTGATQADWTALETWSNLSGDEKYSKDCSHNIVENGTYVVVAKDVAGNVKTFEREFTGISDVTPDAPSITVSVGTKDDSSGWYIGTAPTAKISTNNYMDKGIPVTSDKVPLHTDYSIQIKGINSDVQRTYTASDYSIDLNYEGEVTITAVNISASDKKSAQASAVIKVDTVKPVIAITGSSIDTDGNLVIKYTISDATSGVNVSKVTINDEPTLVGEPNVSGTVEGTFTALPGVVYTIKAQDIAGNLAEDVQFKPLEVVASPITDITTNSALLNAEIKIGTYNLSNYYIAYKKHSADKYVKYSLVNATPTAEGISLVCPFKNLDVNTVYDYKIYAITETSKEVKEIEGSFKTGSITGAATVYGSAKYDSSLINSYKTYPIYVTLFEGNTSVGGVVINSDQDKDYIFKNVADGSYQVTATNGLLSKTASVTVENGGITYPKNYLSSNGINLVLSGLSTSVEIEDSAINLTADNLDIIYDDDFNINVTTDDYQVVNDGGHILVTLHAKYLNVASDVSESKKGILQDKLGKDAEIVRYIELYVTKTVTDKNGVSTTSYITELIDPITISFPLGDLAGQKIYVASLHDSSLGDADYDFYNWSTPAEASISTNYVTITTSRFSLYALYRYLASEKTYTVKWLDGDGKVMKSEKVKDGESATPPTETPTKTATDKYTYTFEKWDTDYTAIKQDTVVAAWFTANKIVKPGDEPTTEQPTTEAPTTEAPTTETPVTEPNKNKVPDTVVVPPSNNKNDGQITTSGNRYSYLGSAESPKTGDATPIVILSVAMIVSMAGIVILLRKKKDN